MQVADRETIEKTKRGVLNLTWLCIMIGGGLLFTLVLNPSAAVAAPPDADAGGPYVMSEGEIILLDASASSDPDGDIILYEWDLDNDGEYDDATGVTAYLSFGDNGIFTVGLRVSDNSESDTDSAEVTINNVPPSVSMDTTEAFGFVGVAQTHQATATDPGSDDLTFEWFFDSMTGPMSIYFNDGYGPDPYPSAGGTFPFSTTDIAFLTFDVPGWHTVTVTVSDDDGGATVTNFQKLIYIQMDIDISPNSSPNSILCTNLNRIISVAVLTTDSFDVTTVDHTTVTFEGASEIHIDKKTGEPVRHEKDVDGDGDIDLVFHFRLGDTLLTCDSEEGSLIGETFDGQPIRGSDAVKMINTNIQ